MTAFAAPMLAPFRPRPTPADPIELATMQRARLRSSIAWLVAGVVGAHVAGMSVLASTAQASGWVWSGLTALVALAMLVVGFAQVGLLARAERAWIPAATTIATLAAIAVVLAPFAGFLWIMLGMVHLTTPLAAMAFGIVLLSFDPSMRAGAARPVRGVVAGAILATLGLAVALLDALVLLPMSLVPGMPLPELYEQLGGAGEAGWVWLPFAWAGLWLAAIVLLALGLLRNRRSQRGSLGILLAVPVVALLALPVLEFPIGMGIADTMATGGGMSVAFPAVGLAAVLLAALACGLLIGAGRR